MLKLGVAESNQEHSCKPRSLIDISFAVPSKLVLLWMLVTLLKYVTVIMKVVAKNVVVVAKNIVAAANYVVVAAKNDTIAIVIVRVVHNVVFVMMENAKRLVVSLA
eukprot:m.14837 g.14837  ORF g.14837 m.14837 type:complete len:106 (-) comp10309_c1_seq1:133-450(-)